MAHDRSNERPLFIAANDIEVGVTPNRQISILLGKPHPSLGFDPDLVLATEVSPAEARAIAALLVRKADEAEEGLPRG